LVFLRTDRKVQQSDHSKKELFITIIEEEIRGQFQSQFDCFGLK
jgi:hypothetical protein